MSRNHKARRTFKVDMMLEQVLEKNKGDLPCRLSLGGYMTLTFLGFYDKTLDEQFESVKVEISLLKISHKKRKDSTSTLMQSLVNALLLYNILSLNN